MVKLGNLLLYTCVEESVVQGYGDDLLAGCTILLAISSYIP